MSDSARIEQFRKMAEADPNNELGHFSLGRAYLDGGMFHEAVASLQRVIALNPKLSKAYQLLATALLKVNQKDAAIAQLTQGVKIAAERGDMMPKNDMVAMLKELGAPIPETAAAVQDKPLSGNEVLCSRCGRVGPKLPAPPFSNAQGKVIFEKVCADCWREWIGMGTKVINELRLPLHDPQAQKLFDQHMMEFLNLKA
ncbi:MAG TPA: Fe(2+)-trafficking protein [Tepidisphaeraceae bacterium]|jgi:Fe-S cluster biosynthesis and repair protein YggX